jgi:nucleoside-diphosphate-sugar epimerase
LAGLSGVRDSLDRPTEYWKENVIAGQRLFDYFPNTKILYASSSTAIEPWRNPYAMSKYSLEQIAPENSIGMRFTTVYGPGAREHMLIPRILRNDVPFVHTNHTRDFIHVDDIISAIDTLMKSEFTGVTDIGIGKSYNLLEMIMYFGIDFKEKRVGNEFEREDNTADTKILNKLNWSVKTDLYNYIKENKNVN